MSIFCKLYSHDVYWHIGLLFSNLHSISADLWWSMASVAGHTLIPATGSWGFTADRVVNYLLQWWWIRIDQRTQNFSAQQFKGQLWGNCSSKNWISLYLLAEKMSQFPVVCFESHGPMIIQHFYVFCHSQRPLKKGLRGAFQLTKELQEEKNLLKSITKTVSWDHYLKQLLVCRQILKTSRCVRTKWVGSNSEKPLLNWIVSPFWSEM